MMAPQMILPESSAKNMKCALISDHGNDIDRLLKIGTRAIPERKKGELLVQVRAVALAPGDIRVMKGSCDLFQSPGSFPYIPGGDLSGVVEEADAYSRFKKGDEVIAMFELPKPLNSLAEYALAKESLAEIKPANISWVESAALTSSAVSALYASKRHIKEGSRVLILGAAGGVGTFLIQFCKLANASYIAATSTAASLLKDLGVDRVIDYRYENWWDIPEFEDNPFDVIVDLGVGKKQSWTFAKNYSILKNQNGKYVTFSGHNPDMQVHNIFQAIGMTAALGGRMVTSACWPFSPKYVWHTGLDLKPGTIKELTDLVSGGKVKVVFDPISPLPFTNEGIAKGFHLMESRHAHGKVIVEIKKVTKHE